jgi:hypothetical protein
MNKILLTTGLAAVILGLAWADGVPEPGVIMYGEVRDTVSNLLVTSGTLDWSVGPAGSVQRVRLRTNLENINGRFSYRLCVPFEALVGSSTPSAAALQALGAATTYDRALVWFNGTNAATFPVPALASFTFKAADRGLVQRVDLRVTLPAGSGPGPGLAGLDSDGDGMSDADEVRAGTDPQDGTDYLRFTGIARLANGDVALTWKSVATCAYTLLWTTNAGPGSVYGVIGSGIPGSAGATTFVDTNAAPWTQNYYRLQVQP